MSASLIGRLRSSAFRLSAGTVSMSLGGSRFSSDSAQRPYHGIRGSGGTIFTAARPTQADIRTHLIHRPARDIIPWRKVWSIGHQTGGFDVIANAMHRRQPRAQCQRIDAYPVGADERAKCNIVCLPLALARSEGKRNSSARRSSILATSKPRFRAAETSAISNTEAGLATSPMIANRRSPATISLNSSSRLAPRSAVWFDRPVMLPPGRTRLATRPVRTGSPATNTIGMTDVACLAARTGGVPDVRMTSTLSRTNSAAISAKRSLRPSAHTRSRCCALRSNQVRAIAAQKRRPTHVRFGWSTNRRNTF